MENPYQQACLKLTAGIHRALEQLEARNYGEAEKILRDVWKKAAAGEDSGDVSIQPEHLIFR